MSIVSTSEVAEPTSYAALVAANIRAARARADISQASCARRMRALGFESIYPQTIGTIEREERQVSAAEAVALAFVLGTTPEVLLTPPPDVQAVLFGGQAIPGQRFRVVDDSVSWDGDDLMVSEAMSGYSPEQLRVIVKALTEWDREQLMALAEKDREQKQEADRRPRKTGRR
jgi:transcriptional regulator with XRE-family HTH domain